MNKNDHLYLSVRKLRDRRAESLGEELRADAFSGYFSLEIGRALLGLLLISGLISIGVAYVKNIRGDVLIFFVGQVYLVLGAVLLLIPFWVKLFHRRSGVRQQALRMIWHKKSKLLRFLLLFLSLYFFVLLLLIGVSFLSANDSFSVKFWHLPTLNHVLYTLYQHRQDSFYGFWLGGSVFVGLTAETISAIDRRRYKLRYRMTSMPERYPFGLWLGKTTGLLARLSHGAGMARGQEICLGWRDAAQNILILGGIGSGKTTQLIHPLLAQVLDQDCGGLIFDIKGNFAQTVKALATATGHSRRLFLIGPEYLALNLIEGLTPEVAASFLKSSLMLGGTSDVNRFFTDTATELCRTSLGVLSFIPGEYHLHALYNYIFDESYQQNMDEKIEVLLKGTTLSADKLSLLKSYRRYRQQTFDQFDEKLKGSILASVAHILSPFNHPELIRAFCQSTECQLEQVLEGAIFLVQLPLSIWGLGGKVADNFIKLRFFNVMQQRELRSEWNQKRLVFFMCDEYQEIVSANKEGLSDLNFWDKSRSSKTLGIISAQSIKSFYAAIGDRDCADAILQNFRQKLCFRTEDQETLDYLNRLTGRVEVEKVTESRQSGSSSSPGSNRHQSRTQTVTSVERQVIDPQLIRNLHPNQAVALLIIEGYSRDDVLDTEAIYI